MYEKYQLKNGLTIVLAESQKSPVVSVQMWVKTGSADEQQKEEGVSHFIEHLVFKGTARYGVGEIAATVEGAGGELNAYTSFDETVFYVTISKAFADVALDCVSQMMGFPLFDENEIDREREVVIEEIKRTMDNPHRQSAQLLFQTLYKKHPYRRPVIGYDRVIRNVSRKTLVNYYNRRYVPRNMTLVVSGDFDRKKMKREIERYYAPIPSHPLKKIRRPTEPAQKSQRVAVQNWSFKEDLLYITWPLPHARHADIPALEVLALILGAGDSSRLARSLRLERSLVNHIGASVFAPTDRGFMSLSSSFQPEQLSEALKVISSELGRFLREGPTAEEMHKAIVNFESDEYYSIETVDGLARKVGHYENIFGDYRHFERFLAEIKKVSASRTREVARRYLKPGAMSVVVSSSADSKLIKRSIGDFRRAYRSDYASSLRARSTLTRVSAEARLKFKSSRRRPAKDNSILRFDLPGHGQLVIRPNHDTPVLNVRLGYLGGSRYETPGQQGLTELLARTWSSRTRRLEERALNHLIESQATSLSSFGGRNSMGLQMTTLAPLAPPVRSALMDLLVDPFIDDAIVEREKLYVLEQQRKRDDNPAQQSILQFMRALFGSHPYARDPLGQPETIRSLKAGDLTGFLGTHGVAGALRVVVAGDVDPAEWRQFLTERLKDRPGGLRTLRTLSWAPPEKKQILFSPSDKEQSHVILGYAGLTYNDEAKYALEVATSVLSGQGGRLFIELRDKASLAYSVAPLRMEGIEAGYFGGYIACSPEKTDRAIAMMKAEFEKLATNELTAEELGRAQRYLIGRHDIELQRASAVGAGLFFDLLYDSPRLELFEYAQRIWAVTPAAVREVCQRIFSRPETISVVGQREPAIKGA